MWSTQSSSAIYEHNQNQKMLCAVMTQHHVDLRIYHLIKILLLNNMYILSGLRLFFSRGLFSLPLSIFSNLTSISLILAMG